MSRTTHGRADQNAAHDLRASMTPETESEMSRTKSKAVPNPIPPRPQLTSHQSSSLPSTPYQHPRDIPFRPGSPNEQDMLSASPRSTHSESTHSLPSLRKVTNGCRFETGLAFAKRRFLYSLGVEKLESEKPSKERLDEHLENNLTRDITELYNKLFPTVDSERRRVQLVEKLEDLFNRRWPGHSIKVNVFGSTGNNLGTNESDVDICITTDFKELEHVCLLAEVLAENGMERVVCVSSAKVPIVKIWDPALQLACDMNVNNPVALENTQMIKTYVEIDPRVRPLALIVKYWTRRRLLNDAALGATLSSYTWICMIVNFLQTRDPPVLPALQQYPHLPQKTMEGLNVSYMADLEQVRGFGDKNQDSLGKLLYDFFKYYGHELDYDTAIVSVREGKVTDKQTQPSWQINRLCVEEPFNYSRNLANTADDTSFRGIHLELRRACKQLCDHNLESCCEQFEHAREEPRTFPRHSLHHARPIATTPASQINKGHGSRGVSNITRGGRYASFQNRAPQNTGRRASSASNKAQNFPRQPLVNPTMTQHEVSIQHQQHQQQMLHDHLYQQYQLLQAQEQELRMQLRQQAAQQSATAPSMLYPQIPFPGAFAAEPGSEGAGRPRAGTINQPPLTAPLQQSGFNYPSPYLSAYGPASQGTLTNPPSPLLNAVIPDLRRRHRRSSVTNGSSGGSLRAHSQPPRTATSPLFLQEGFAQHLAFGDMTNPQLQIRNRVVPSPASLSREMDSHGYPFPRTPLAMLEYSPRPQPSEYIGYYLGPPAPSQKQPSLAYPPFGTHSSIPRNGTQPPLSVPHGSVTQSSPTSPTSKARTVFSPGTSKSTASECPSSPINRPQTALRVNGGPLIVDGSKGHPNSNRSVIADEGDGEGEPLSYSTSTSDDIAVNTPTSSNESINGRSGLASVGAETTPAPISNLSEDENKAPSGKLRGLGVRQVLNESEIPKSFRNNQPFTDLSGRNDGEFPLSKAVVAATVPNDLVAVHEDRGRSKTSRLSKERFDYNQSLHLLPKDRTPTPSTNGRGTLANGLSPSTASEQILDQKNYPEGASLGAGQKQRPALASPLILNGDKPNCPGPGADTRAVENAHGWHVQTKKRRDAALKPNAEVAQLNALGGQNLPADASLRKGG